MNDREIRAVDAIRNGHRKIHWRNLGERKYRSYYDAICGAPSMPTLNTVRNLDQVTCKNCLKYMAAYNLKLISMPEPTE